MVENCAEVDWQRRWSEVELSPECGDENVILPETSGQISAVFFRKRFPFEDVVTLGELDVVVELAYVRTKHPSNLSADDDLQ